MRPRDGRPKNILYPTLSIVKRLLFNSKHLSDLVLLIITRTLVNNFLLIWNQVKTFSVTKIRLKIQSVKLQPFGSGFICLHNVAWWRHMAAYIWVNISIYDVLSPDNIKPLPASMLTPHLWGSVARLSTNLCRSIYIHVPKVVEFLPYRKMICLSYVFNTMATNDLIIQGTHHA